MRVLLIKTSSMGDIIHTFPALTDAGKVFPDLTFDWVVEKGFTEIPFWHPLVRKVIPVQLRSWRKALFSLRTWQDIALTHKTLKNEQYDLILDAQGLMKSAWLTFLAKGKRTGLDFSSARESIASFAYQQKCTVNFYQHAVLRMRQLFAKALSYTLPETPADFGLQNNLFHNDGNENYLVFLHGTTWTTKLWPEIYWQELAALAGEAGFRVKVSGGNQEELARAHRLAKACAFVDVLPKQTITDFAKCLANAKAVVAVDTGLGHIASALNVPTVSLYGATDPKYTGALGLSSLHLKTNFSCSPCLSKECHYREKTAITPACYMTLPPQKVWEAVKGMLLTPSF